MKPIFIFLLILMLGISLLILPLFAIMPYQTKVKTEEDKKAIKDISSIGKIGIALVIVGGIGSITIFICYSIFGIDKVDMLYT